MRFDDFKIFLAANSFMKILNSKYIKRKPVVEDNWQTFVLHPRLLLGVLHDDSRVALGHHATANDKTLEVRPVFDMPVDNVHIPEEHLHFLFNQLLRGREVADDELVRTHLLFWLLEANDFAELVPIHFLDVRVKEIREKTRLDEGLQLLSWRLLLQDQAENLIPLCKVCVFHRKSSFWNVRYHDPSRGGDYQIYMIQ
jgi:hypothetical protein